MEGESFGTNLIPSLVSNVSFIKVIESQNNPIEYRIESNYFSISPSNGRVYLVKQITLPKGIEMINEKIKLTVTNLLNTQSTMSVYNTVKLVNINSNPPTFITDRRVYEIQEDNPVPTDLKYRNGTIIEIQISSNDITNGDLTVDCEASINFPDVCNKFIFKKNLFKSTGQYWFGTIQAQQSLDYNDGQFYQLTAVARNDDNRETRTVYQINVLASLNKPPKLSDESLEFTIEEELPVVSFV
jgi:hypothetical protein